MKILLLTVSIWVKMTTTAISVVLAVYRSDNVGVFHLVPPRSKLVRQTKGSLRYVPRHNTSQRGKTVERPNAISSFPATSFPTMYATLPRQGLRYVFQTFAYSQNMSEIPAALIILSLREALAGRLISHCNAMPCNETSLAVVLQLCETLGSCLSGLVLGFRRLSHLFSYGRSVGLYVSLSPLAGLELGKLVSTLHR